MKPHTFLVANAIITAVITICLYDLSKEPLSQFVQSPGLDALAPYYSKRSILQVATYSAVLKGVTIFCSMALSLLLFGYLIPKTSSQILYFMALAIPISFIQAYLVKVMVPFTDLDDYYKKVNTGVADALNTMLTVVVTYFGIKYVMPFL